jgi:hypothetical protein
MNQKIFKEYLIDVYEYQCTIEWEDKGVKQMSESSLKELKDENTKWDFSSLTISEVESNLDLPDDLKFDNWKIKRRQNIISDIENDENNE